MAKDALAIPRFMLFRIVPPISIFLRRGCRMCSYKGSHHASSASAIKSLLFEVGRPEKPGLVPRMLADSTRSAGILAGIGKICPAILRIRGGLRVGPFSLRPKTQGLRTKD